MRLGGAYNSAAVLLFGCGMVLLYFGRWGKEEKKSIAVMI